MTEALPCAIFTEYETTSKPMANNERRQQFIAAIGNNIKLPDLVKELYYGADGPGGEKGVVEEALDDAVKSTDTQLDDIALAALAPALADALFSKLDEAWNGVLADQANPGGSGGDSAEGAD